MAYEYVKERKVLKTPEGIRLIGEVCNNLKRIKDSSLSSNTAFKLDSITLGICGSNWETMSAVHVLEELNVLTLVNKGEVTQHNIYRFGNNGYMLEKPFLLISQFIHLSKDW